VKYFGVALHSLRESAGSWPAKPPGLVARVVRSATAGTRLRLESRAFRGEGPFGVIHAHFGPNGVRAVRLRERRVIAGPVLTSFYGYDVGRPGARDGYDQLFAQGDLFIALSEEMRDRLVSLGCPQQRIAVHRLGIDLDRLRPRQHGTNRRLEILSIARLVPKKGIEDGLRAVAELAKRGRDVAYTIVGDGPLRGRLEQRARELDVGRLVNFTGARPANEIPQFLGAADVLLAPSVTAGDGDAEGTPVAILEAQAAGIPVVSTLHAGIPEIVEDSRSGFLVAEGDVPALTEKLAELSDNPSLRATMGIAGRAIVMGKHDIRVLNQELARIYASLAAKNVARVSAS
jgi:colanic acid/amylovoran biosynthesis glycosyltransferase